MQVAMPDLGAVLELRELIGGPRGQFVTSAGETDGLSAFRHRAHRLVEAVKIGQLHMVEHHQQIDVAVRPGLATQIAALQSHAQQTFAECLPQCRHRQRPPLIQINHHHSPYALEFKNTQPSKPVVTAEPQ